MTRIIQDRCPVNACATACGPSRERRPSSEGRGSSVRVAPGTAAAAAAASAGPSDPEASAADPVTAAEAAGAAAVAEPEPTSADATVATAASTAAATSAWLPMFEGRSPDPAVCPFLRTQGTDGVLAAPIETPDAANRCAALAEAAPQSLRQQELVCLTATHVDCPRYLRGATAVTEVPVAPVISIGRPSRLSKDLLARSAA